MLVTHAQYAAKPYRVGPVFLPGGKPLGISIAECEAESESAPLHWAGTSCWCKVTDFKPVEGKTIQRIVSSSFFGTRIS
jgi:hypothetical protein